MSQKPLMILFAWMATFLPMQLFIYINEYGLNLANSEIFAINY